MYNDFDFKYQIFKSFLFIRFLGNLKIYSVLFRFNFEQWILISAKGKLDMDKDKKLLKHWLFKKNDVQSSGMYKNND